MRVFISAIIILCSLGLAYGLYANKPVSKKKKPQVTVPVVDTITLEKRSEKIFLEAFGTVIPARMLELHSEVEGRIITLNKEVVPGGIVQKGDLLLEVDAENYELYVAEMQADVARAEYELELERGQQVIAKKEWQLLKKDLESSTISKTLVLREPHLKQAQIQLEAAKSKLAAAQLDVKRTKLYAPFHGLILSESVEVSQLINRQSKIITLVDIDTFWVRVSLPFSSLNQIFLAEKDSPSPDITISWEQENQAKVERSGTLFKLLGDLEPKGRMARILVSLDDPFNLSGAHSGKILLGSFAKVKIEAGVLEDIYVIPRTAMADDHIWLVNDQDKLEKVEVRILWSRLENQLVAADLPDGARLVTSRLLSPLAGMRVMTGDGTPRQKKKR